MGIRRGQSVPSLRVAHILPALKPLVAQGDTSPLCLSLPVSLRTSYEPEPVNIFILYP